MKKLLSMVLLLVLLVVSPVMALFCHICGKEVPKDANFCPFCGKTVARAFQTAPPLAKSENSIKTVSNTIQSVTNTAEVDRSLENYENINKIEQLLTTTSCDIANIRAKELRIKHDKRMISVESSYSSFSPYQRKLHDLHIQKLKALESYFEAWKGSEHGSDPVRSLAQKDKALFVLSHTNEAIDTLLNGGMSLSSIAKVADMEQRLKKTTRNFVVTSKYLVVNNHRLQNGEPIWVIDVVSAEAKVLHMGHGRTFEPISGWVSIYDLEKRSTWRSDPAFFYSAPNETPLVVYDAPRTPPVRIIYQPKCRDRYYRYDRHRYDRHRYGYPYGSNRHNDKYRYSKQCSKKNKHYRKSHVIIDPRYW